MASSIARVTVVVPDYDDALAFYVGVLGFELVEDHPQPQAGDPGKRWVTVRPPGGETSLVLGRAKNDAERAAIGHQTGGRVFLFLHTDDFDGTVARLTDAGVTFVRPVARQPYGRVTVFADPFGNLWDLIEPAD